MQKRAAAILPQPFAREDMMDYSVADAHCDFLYYMLHRGYDISAPRHGQAVDIQGMLAGGAAMQLFAAWIDPDEDTTFLQQCMSLIDAYKRMLAGCDKLVELTKDFVPGQGKIAAVLTIEGGEAIEERLENLRLFHELGVRAMTLTWNDQNELASPAMARRDKGISRLGRSVVREMERLNMAVDVAHLSDISIDGVFEEISGPVFSSHTNARSVLAHRRSLCDRHIKEISRRDGVVGVNYYSPQLVHRGRAGIDDIVRHIEHIAAVGGINCVALGSDFDGMGLDAYPVGLTSWNDVPKLMHALERAGFKQDDIRKIACDNLMGFMKKLV